MKSNPEHCLPFSCSPSPFRSLCLSDSPLLVSRVALSISASFLLSPHCFLLERTLNNSSLIALQRKLWTTWKSPLAVSGERDFFFSLPRKGSFKTKAVFLIFRLWAVCVSDSLFVLPTHTSQRNSRNATVARDWQKKKKDATFSFSWPWHC